MLWIERGITVDPLVLSGKKKGKGVSIRELRYGVTVNVEPGTLFSMLVPVKASGERPTMMMACKENVPPMEDIFSGIVMGMLLALPPALTAMVPLVPLAN